MMLYEILRNDNEVAVGNMLKSGYYYSALEVDSELAALREQLAESQKHAETAEAELARVRAALEWYLEDDRRSLEQGLIEKLEDRPAFAALQPAGGESAK